jgi:hypothetical protein
MGQVAGELFFIAAEMIFAAKANNLCSKPRDLRVVAANFI